ncbi:Threonine synthase [Leptospira kirschneri serovar Mozdok]|nr:Threonine synthase [Leptospira kirschneri serovar Mozdok]
MISTLTRYKAEFECINDSCKTRYDLNEIIYECKKCGSLLQVSHDLDALKSVSGQEWKDLFDSRFRSVKFPNPPEFGTKENGFFLISKIKIL